MWPFLLILAIVPMIFYWSDSVRELFPQLSPYLPDKTATEFVDATQVLTLPGARNPLPHLQWTQSQTEQGFVAWAMSYDQAYRIAAGCRAESEAVLQVTHVSAQPIAGSVWLNYQYGAIQLTDGAYAGPELVGTVAQLGEVYLQTDSGVVLAQFDLPEADSGLLARELEQHCVIVR